MTSRDSERSLVPRTQCDGDIFSPSFTGMGVGWCDIFPIAIICACGLQVVSVVSCHISQVGGLSLCLPLPAALKSPKYLRLKLASQASLSFAYLSSCFYFTLTSAEPSWFSTSNWCNKYIFICISSSSFSFPLKGLFPYLMGFTAGNNSKSPLEGASR